MLTPLDPPRKKHLNADAKYVYVARNPWDCYVSILPPRLQSEALETNDCLLRTLMKRSTVEHMKKVLVLDVKGEENPAMNGLFKGRKVYVIV
ncbi:hypothetical protein MRX96_001753 [Rhipicephalus microplus]